MSVLNRNGHVDTEMIDILLIGLLVLPIHVPCSRGATTQMRFLIMSIGILILPFHLNCPSLLSFSLLALHLTVNSYVQELAIWHAGCMVYHFTFATVICLARITSYSVFTSHASSAASTTVS